MKKFKLLLASALMVSFLTGCSSEKMKLKTDTLTIEYGKTVSSDVKDYLDNTDEFLKEVFVNAGNAIGKKVYIFTVEQAIEKIPKAVSTSLPLMASSTKHAFVTEHLA